MSVRESVRPIHRLFALATGLLCAMAAAAQVAPPPAAAVFIDRDSAARVFFPALETEAGRARLERYLRRRPDDPRAWGARAYVHALDGNVDAMRADLERAHGVVDANALATRNTLWSEGWARLHVGQVPEAHAAWTRAMQMHGGQPFWVPYTFALLAELGGERHTAMAWLELAARAMPGRWGTRDAVLASTRHWQDAEREAMLALFDAWWRTQGGSDPA